MDRIPKAEWGEGEWQNEPDRIEWIDKATGYSCLARRNTDLGFWCGYVGLPVDHSSHGDHYDEINDRFSLDIECTYSEDHQPQDEEGVEIENTHDLWWVGFACAEFGDVIPMVYKTNTISIKSDETYKNLAYVKEKCANLATALRLYEKGD